MKLDWRRFDLKLAHTWTIASGLKPGGHGGTDTFKVVFVELKDRDGVIGVGEAAPSSRYQENVDGVTAFLQHVAPEKLSFDDVESSMAYVNAVAPKNFAAKGALNIALLDGAARKRGQAIYDF